MVYGPKDVEISLLFQKVHFDIIGLIPILGPILDFLNVTDRKLKRELLLYLLNPASFVFNIFVSLIFIILKLIDLGSSQNDYHSVPRMFLKGLILAPFVIINILLAPIIRLLDLPLKLGCFLYDKYIASDEKGTNELAEDVQENVPESKDNPVKVVRQDLGSVQPVPQQQTTVVQGEPSLQDSQVKLMHT